MPTITSTLPEPPAAAVAADPHWTATRDRLRSRQRPTASLVICDDPNVRKALEEAKFIVRSVTASVDASPDDASLKKDLAAAQKTLDAAQAAFDAIAITLRFQAMRRPDFEDLKKNHPPTEEQAEDGLSVNVDSIGPTLTADDASYYLDEWAEGEAAAMFSTAWNVQSGVRMDVGKG
jgi:hypothetical protein